MSKRFYLKTPLECVQHIHGRSNSSVQMNRQWVLQLKTGALILHLQDSSNEESSSISSFHIPPSLIASITFTGNKWDTFIQLFPPFFEWTGNRRSRGVIWIWVRSVSCLVNKMTCKKLNMPTVYLVRPPSLVCCYQCPEATTAVQLSVVTEEGSLIQLNDTEE